MATETVRELDEIELIPAIKLMRKAIRTSLIDSKQICQYIQGQSDGLCLKTIGDFIEMYNSKKVIMVECKLYREILTLDK